MLMHIRRLCSTKFNTEDMPMVSLKYSVLKMSRLGLGKGRGKSVNIQIQASHVISAQVKLQNLLRTDSRMLQLSFGMKRLESIQLQSASYKRLLSAAYLQLLLLSWARVLPLLMANSFRVLFSEFKISQLKSTVQYWYTLYSEACEIVAIPWSKYHLWVMTARQNCDAVKQTTHDLCYFLTCYLYTPMLHYVTKKLIFFYYQQQFFRSRCTAVEVLPQVGDRIQFTLNSQTLEGKVSWLHLPCSDFRFSKCNG